MNSVIVVSQFVFEEQNSTGYYWSKIVKKLACEGLNVKVVYAADEKFKLSLEGVESISVYSTKISNEAVMYRALGQIKLSLKFFWQIFKSVKSDDVVFSGTNPSLFLFLMPLLKVIFKFKWVLLVHDVYPNNLIPSGILKSKKSLTYKILNFIYNRIYSSPNKLLVIGRDMKEVMTDKIGSSKKIVFIPNWVDEKQVFPLAEDVFLEGKCIKIKNEDVVFQFFGNIGRLQGIDNLLEAISLTKNPKLVFVFFGEGVYLNKLKKFIQDNPHLNIFYGGVVSAEERNSCLASCDIALVTLDAGMFGLGVPSKAYFSMAADKPILAVMDKDSEVSRVIGENYLGWTCLSNSPQELAQLLDYIVDTQAHLKVVSSRRVLLDKYSQDMQLASIYDEVLEVLRN